MDGIFLSKYLVLWVSGDTMGQGFELNFPRARGNRTSKQELPRQQDSGWRGRLAALRGRTLNAKSAPIAGGAVLTSYIFGKSPSSWQPFWKRSTMVPCKYNQAEIHSSLSNRVGGKKHAVVD